eukprot:TRINITY_DN464_c0_g1_i2.p1 TRINITY_DN464_c0_g1~~TRINITY_DN464_c0_g1_i2.p1  ORF type:complete len:287 (-),score=56.20 TRINITY_DN464_c0_g1_i2:57-917(-)
MSQQKNWRHCKDCGLLFFGGGDSGRCAETAKPHDGTGSKNYSLHYNKPDYGQNKWKWCKKCSIIQYEPSKGHCLILGDADHTSEGSGDYSIGQKKNPEAPGTESGWHWCKKCAGLWKSQGSNRCSYGGTHVSDGSGDYALDVVDNSSTDDKTDEGTEFFIVSELGDFVLDASNATTAGSVVYLWPYHGGENQRWRINSKGEIVSVKSGLVLEVKGGISSGNGLILNPSNGSDAQKFRTHKDGTIRTEKGDLALDVNGSKTANGTEVLAYTINGNKNQKWRLVSRWH